MILTIITINRNNKVGLEKTMRSVLAQTRTDFEYIVVDGASTDGSVSVIERYAPEFGGRLIWISEPDSGIYNAMNKGIRMASGKYLEFLNSGDSLVSDKVVEQMLDALEKKGDVSILYGNMLKDIPGKSVFRDKSFAGQEITFLGFFRGTLNHSPAYIRRSLFDEYGYYDENLKIVSDWKWYLQVIILGGEKPVYVNVDVTLFDMTGISETNKELDCAERKKVLGELIPAPVLADYEEWSYSVVQMRRLKRHPWAFRLVRLIERGLFKMEKIRERENKVLV